MLRTLLRLFLIFIFFFFVLNFARNIWRTWHAGERIEDAQEKLEKVRAENARLRQGKERLESSNFLEEQAHNKLFMAKKNEVILILPTPVSQGEDSFNEQVLIEEEKEIWQKWLGLFW